MFTQIAALRPLIGQARSGEDWRRVAMNLPGSEELRRLQNEQKDLQACSANANARAGDKANLRRWKVCKTNYKRYIRNRLWAVSCHCAA